jgi:hypothetical protein
MAEAKNNFLSSKMNKDLEQRLVPNNEYRDANNVMISRSEGDDVGSLEVVLGNRNITNFGYDPSCDVEVIGYYMDESANRVYVFLTDYWDSSPDQLSNFANTSANCSIAVYDFTAETYTRLVEGYWLNFSKTQPVLGVNVIEQKFLFWTDNRNQPRKININSALANPATGPSPYYTCEDQISVSKYYPYQTPLLVKEEVVNFNIVYPTGTLGYIPSVKVPTSGGTGTGLTVNILTVNGAGQITGLSIADPGTGYSSGDTLTVDGGAEDATFSVVIEWVSTMVDTVSEFLPDGISPNPSYDSDWGGDKNYLKDKFIRFAYRFKFDDGEYSLISPFTQACFVPKQDGYFTGNADEVESYTSTEVEFMENQVKQIDLIIPSPSGTWSNVIDKFKITEIDIIFKRSDINSLNVVETFKITDPAFLPYLNQPLFQYSYLSEKPYRTLPDPALLRVYDKVPVKALSQEAQENRIIYGNFLDKHTPPDKLDYFVDIDIKEQLGTTADEQVRKEYQNHTLKQNRTYQAGIVLSDRYGRQSSVILSDDERSTVFHPYKDGGNLFSGASFVGGPNQAPNSFSYWGGGNTEQNLMGPVAASGTMTDTWPGDQLGLVFINTIQSIKNNSTGTPGLYNDYGKVSDIKIVDPGTGYSNSSYVDLTCGDGTGLGISITVDGAGAIQTVTVDTPGINFVQGCSITLSGGGGNGVIEILNTEAPNPLGWYSYKVVVKQSENEYYNIYHPGVLNGYIDGEGPNPGRFLNPSEQIGATLEDPTIHFALHGDNINKVPKDITLLGPNQNIFRTARPSLADDPSYYEFVDTGGTKFSISPYDEEGQALLKLKDRERELDSGSQITNAAVTLYPRVMNWAATGLAPIAFPTAGWDIGKSSKQWYPGTRVTTVTTIATGRELGLWDASAPSPYNTAPVFYGYENNPLIAKATVEINKSLPAANNNWQRELDKYGASGPSPKAGKVIYNLDWSGFTQGADYVAGSKNLNTKVQSGSSSLPNQGEDGQGIRMNIDFVNDGAGTAAGDPGEVGPLLTDGASIANQESDPSIRGFDDPNYTYPFDVNLQVIGGDEGGYIRLNAAKTKWPGYMLPYLSIHETQPIESKLDIYWETSTEGLIEDLNDDILNNDEFLPVRLSVNGGANVANFFESIIPGGTVGSTPIYAVAADGTKLEDNVTITYLSCIDDDGTDVTSKFFKLGTGIPGEFRMTTNALVYFLYDVLPNKNTFTMTFNVQAPTPTFSVDGTTTNTQLTLRANLRNVCPTFDVTSGPSSSTPGIVYNQPGQNNCAISSGVGTTNLGNFSQATFPTNLLSVVGVNGTADATLDRDRVTFNQNATPGYSDGWMRIFAVSSGVEVLSTNWWNGSQIGGGFAWTGINPGIPNPNSVGIMQLNAGFPTGDYRVEIRCSEGIAQQDINTGAGNSYLDFTVVP